MFPQGEAERNIEVEGKQNSLFPEGPVIKCFVIPPDSKLEKKLWKNDLVDAFAYGGCVRGRAAVKTELLYQNNTIIIFFFVVNTK